MPTNTYTTPGSSTWTVPAGVTSAIFEVWGPGGLGGDGDGVTLGGGGGGGGGYGKATFAVTPGDDYTIYIGSGAADEAHIIKTSGAVNKITVASGGDGSPGAGAAGSSPSIGAGATSTTSTAGGSSSDPSGSDGTGGGNGAGPGGGGGGGAGVGGNGGGGAPPGGGGGGGYLFGFGGSGAAGKAQISWTIDVSSPAPVSQPAQSWFTRRAQRAQVAQPGIIQQLFGELPRLDPVPPVAQPDRSWWQRAARRAQPIIRLIHPPFVAPTPPTPNPDGIRILITEPSLGLTDRTAYLYEPGSQSAYSLTQGQRGTGSLVFVIAGDDAYTPTIGAPVYIQSTVEGVTTILFAGTIDSAQVKFLGDEGYRFVTMNLVSLEQAFDTLRCPPRSYDAGTTWGAIVADLLAIVCSGVPVTAGAISPGAILTAPLVLTDSDVVSDVFSAGATASGYVWYVEQSSSSLQFRAPSSSPAPAVLQGTDIQWETIDWKQTRTDFRDRQTVQMSKKAATVSHDHIATGALPGTEYDTAELIDTLLSASLTIGAAPSYVPLVFASPPADGDTVTITATHSYTGPALPVLTYTFRTTLDNTIPYQVKIGATAAACASYLADAINAVVANAGITYSLPTWENPGANGNYTGGPVVAIEAKTWEGGIGVAIALSSSAINNQFLRSLTIDSSKCGSSDSASFLVYVSISDPTLRSLAHGGNVASELGYDIRFWLDAVATVPTTWEIDYYDSVNGTILAWVLLPSVSHTADVAFYVTYGNVAITRLMSATPWPAAAVYHFRGAAAAPFGPATANSAVYGTGLTLVNVVSVDGALIDGAARFNGTSSAASGIPQVAGLTATISCWVKPTAASGHQTIWASSGNGVDEVHLELFIDGADWKFSTFNPLDSSGGTAVSAGTVTAGVWQWVVAVYDATAANLVRIYVSGTHGTDAAVPTALTRSILPSQWGATAAGTGWYGGDLDEGHLWASALSQDWVTSEYNNQDAPGTFLTMGAQTVIAITGNPGTPATVTTPLVVGTDIANTRGTTALTLATAPPANYILDVTYYRLGAEFIRVEDSALVATRAAIEHGTGRYQTITSDTSDTDYASGLATAQKLLTKYGVLPDVLTLGTYTAGLAPGQELTITSGMAAPIAARIDGQWQIQSVRAQYMAGQSDIQSGRLAFLYQLTLTSSTMPGWLSVWEQMMRQT